MTRRTWNRTTQTYTVSNGTTVVRGIPVKSQADCVAMELRNGLQPSFGVAS
ncbi:hypothetical protein [Devosia sp. A369]